MSFITALFAAKRAHEVFVKQLERDYTAYHALKYKKEIEEDNLVKLRLVTSDNKLNSLITYLEKNIPKKDNVPVDIIAT